MNGKVLIAVSALIAGLAVSAEVRNGDFSRFGGKPPVQKTVDQWHSDGIKCPDMNEWPQYWGCIGKNGTVEFPKDANGNRFARISGKGILFTGYHGLPLKRDRIVLELDIRGTGTLSCGFLNYGKDGNKTVFVSPADGIKAVFVKVDSKGWTRYRFPMDKPEAVLNVHPSFCAYEGTVDIDNVRIYSKESNDDVLALADAENILRKNNSFRTGDAPEIAVDAEVGKIIDSFKKQDQALKDYAAKNPENKLAEKLRKTADEIRPYLLTDGITKIRKDRLNQAAALCVAIEKITGSSAGLAPVAAAAAPQKKTAETAVPAAPVAGQPPFVISDLKPNKLLYVEKENGNVSLKITNNTGKACSATLETAIYTGINDKRTVRKEKIELKPGTTAHRVSYNVGPESFGREIGLKLYDAGGKLLASASEYFQAHREYMRVMMHGTSRYQNFFHFFAHEQSDFGVQMTDDKIYLSCQPLYRIVRSTYKARIRNYKTARHAKISFYQNRGFGGKVGLEEVRKHPEFLLFAENGQPEIDPFYGGIPNPFEIAAPAELDPVRRKELLDGRDFLDVRLSAWHHLMADFTNEDCLIYGTKSIRDYRKAMGIDVLYLDDTPSVMPGYTWEGKYNLAGLSRENIAKMNAKIARIWNSELRKDDPLAGTWCNGISPGSARWLRSCGMWEKTMGLGVDMEKGADVSDEYIKEISSAPNSAFLAEVQAVFLENRDIPERYPENWRSALLERRDYLIQKYKANVVFGYISIPSNRDISKVPEEFSWPTVNYFQALTVATQHHHILYGSAPGIPAMQPFDQFMTRYSGLIWDKEVIAVPKAEAEKTVRIDSSKELDWKDFVYTRKYDDSEALIVHIVRPYPLKKWDLKWDVPATVLNDVKAEIAIPAGKTPVAVKAMRPYLPKEKKEIVEKELPFKFENGKVSFSVPDFSYYTMLAVKFR